MKSKFLLSVALIFSAIQLFAQDRTFKSMGYDDASIIGISGSLSYFIKVRPDDNVDQSNLVINLRASQVLNPNNSFVVVYLKDEPVYTQRVITSALDTLLSFKVPLSSKYLQPDGTSPRRRCPCRRAAEGGYVRALQCASGFG